MKKITVNEIKIIINELDFLRKTVIRKKDLQLFATR